MAASSSSAARRAATLQDEDEQVSPRGPTIADMPKKKEKQPVVKQGDFRYKDTRADEIKNYRRVNPKWLWMCHAAITLPLTLSLALLPSLYATAAQVMSNSVVGVPGTPGGVVKDLLKTATVPEDYDSSNVALAGFALLALSLVDVVALASPFYDQVSNIIATKMALCVFGGAASVFEWIRTMHLLFLFSFLYFFLWMYVYLMVIFLDPSAPDLPEDEDEAEKVKDETAVIGADQRGGELRQRKAGVRETSAERAAAIREEDDAVKKLIEEGEKDNECAGSGQGSCCIGQIVITVPAAFITMKVFAVVLTHLGFTEAEVHMGETLGCILGATGGTYVSGTMWVAGWDLFWSALPALFGACIGTYLAQSIRFHRSLRFCSLSCQENLLMIGLVPILAIISFTVFNILRVSAGQAIPDDDLVFPDDDDVSVLLIVEGAINRVVRIIRLALGGKPVSPSDKARY